MSKQNHPKNFTFKMVKSHDFKTVNIDGVFGSLTIQRRINMNFFVETADTPKNIIHEVASHNRIGKQIQDNTTLLNPSAIREIPFAVNVDVQIAKLIVVWLNEKIKEAEEETSNIIDVEKKENDLKFES